jgi:hypothetical protein
MDIEYQERRWSQVVRQTGSRRGAFGNDLRADDKRRISTSTLV